MTYLEKHGITRKRDPLDCEHMGGVYIFSMPNEKLPGVEYYIGLCYKSSMLPVREA